jgi:uncharacterized metal-binding protein YceD (DUF177 family)
MIYNVATLLTGNLGGSEQHEIENGSLQLEGHSLKEITGPVRLIRTDRTVVITTKIEVVTHGACSRCLGPVTVNVFVNMEEEFYPANADLVDNSGKRSKNGSLDEDEYYDPTLVIDEQNFLDLTVGLG